MLIIIASILSYDIWFYSIHRLMHTKHLYPYHQKSHNYKEPRWDDVCDFINLRTIFWSFGIVIPSFFTTEFCFFQFILAAIFINARGTLRYDRILKCLGNHHLLHHRFHICNYGEPWVDWIFGTKKRIDKRRLKPSTPE